MKCKECPNYHECNKANDLRRKRGKCKKAKEPIVQTNADRIRAMSDEELGQVFGAWCDAGDCANCPELTGDFMRGKMFGVCPLSRKMSWREWLKQPVEEVDKDA